MTGTATAKTHIDNDQVTVTEFSFTNGTNTGWHRHEHDYIIIPMADAKLRIDSAEGSSAAEMKRGEPYFRKAGVEHDVISANEHPFSFFEIEIKA